MCVNIGLVKMDVEANDVLFAETMGNKGIHIFCPFLDVIVPCQVGVVGPLIKVQCLVAEGEFVHTFSAPAKDKLGQRVLPTADILSGIRVFYSTRCKIVSHHLHDGLRLVDWLDDATTNHLKIQVCSCRVIVRHRVI